MAYCNGDEIKTRVIHVNEVADKKADTIFRVIQSVAKELNIESKIISGTTDNAPDVKKVFNNYQLGN